MKTQEEIQKRIDILHESFKNTKKLCEDNKILCTSLNPESLQFVTKTRIRIVEIGNQIKSLYWVLENHNMKI